MTQSNTSASRSARCAVLTVCNARHPDATTTSKLITQSLEQNGHQIAAHETVDDDAWQIRTQLKTWLILSESFDMIVTHGGTGLARRDTTVAVVESLLTKRLEGFGELFRMLYFQKVGPAAMRTRATAGLTGDTLIFALPGSSEPVQLAMEKLIIPEMSYLIWERPR